MSPTAGKRIPLIPTLIVVFAVIAMVRLGFWQLERRHEKEALIARYATNANLPPVAFAALWPVRERELYRRVAADCLSVVGWRAEAGRASGGAAGWRHIASCRTGAEGPGFAVDVGQSQSGEPPRWSGGPVRGLLTQAPDGEPLVARLFRTPPPPTPMIVAEAPAPGLAASARPDPATVTNNHLAYAVQWFLFAAVAAAVYTVALWRRAAPVARGPDGPVARGPRGG